MNLQAYIQLLQTADGTINARNAELLTEAIDDLKNYGQSIGHRRSGNMDDTMYRLGPFPVEQGTIEASFQSGAEYAELEVARGGDHDWATRTIDEQAERIDQLRRDVEDAAVTALTGAGR